ncbi:helix-turn-helix transcriptional regulator [Actinomadura rupiterrae]|uniref:helix-turn-helix transcriptional regulator n=1 Tax=Actinomadura rupiterrae TaxID=559627 RepID=UPI0020A30FBF|nr:LuxR C-terminal-related transcriptional regulator [Actinomadura rupiterrae]MCP2336057.1 non-specific serine/threonine protein kinase [Actinomadura rupiterrae]
MSITPPGTAPPGDAVPPTPGRGSSLARGSGLPQETTGFVGRRDEVARLTALLGTERLVTVVGPGGVGKTRVAVRAAAGAERDFGGCLAFLELSGMREAELLPGALAARLGIPDSDTRAPLDAVIGFLADRPALIVLDTCEHLARGCAELADALLSATPGVTVLATSRQSLGAPGERLFPIAPLPVGPDGGDAVELFEQRAAAVAPGFSVTPENRDAVVAICRTLDGVPLAVELAAARLRALPVDRLAAALDSRFRLLTGRNTQVERHRTLRTAIEWSHDLCTGAERLLWARLSVFAGSFSLAAAERICADDASAIPSGATAVALTDSPDAGDGVLDGIGVVEALIGLVDKSVVLREGGDGANAEDAEGDDRYRMLDTIREFGAERLAALGDADRMAGRHLDHFIALATEFGERMFDDDQLDRTRRMHQDHGNLQAALRYATSAPQPAGAAALSSGLWGYWHMIGRLADGRVWQTRVLEHLPGASAERSWALSVRSHMAVFQGDADVGVRDAEEAAAVARHIGDTWLEGRALMFVALGRTFLGDFEQAAAADERCARLVESGDNRTGLLLFHCIRAYLRLLRGDLDEAVASARRSLDVVGEGSGERWLQSYAHFIMGVASFLQARREHCFTAGCTGLRMKFELGDPIGTAYCLELLAWLAAEQDRFERAGWLLGAADVLWRRSGQRLSAQAILETFHADAERRATAALGEERFRELWRAGASHPLDEVIACAESDTDRLARVRVPRPSGPGDGPDGTPPLTRRELEVAALAVEGLSNREIAERLVISKRTVDAHMEHIFAKLGVTRRVKLAARLRTLNTD